MLDVNKKNKKIFGSIKRDITFAALEKVSAKK